MFALSLRFPVRAFTRLQGLEQATEADLRRAAAYSAHPAACRPGCGPDHGLGLDSALSAAAAPTAAGAVAAAAAESLLRRVAARLQWIH
jgi:hypothetical protein